MKVINCAALTLCHFTARIILMSYLNGEDKLTQFVDGTSNKLSCPMKSLFCVKLNVGEFSRI